MPGNYLSLVRIKTWFCHFLVTLLTLVLMLLNIVPQLTMPKRLSAIWEPKKNIKNDLRCKIDLIVLNQSDFRIKECLHEEFGFSLVYYLS